MKYSEMHVDRGDTYDEVLRTSPFDAYMAQCEARHIPGMIRSIHPSGIRRYMDFACGTGRITALIAPLARETIGVDVSQTMLEAAQAKVPGATFLNADLTSNGVDLGTFEVISSFRFFGNAEPDLRVAALRALNARLVAGGHLLVNNHRNPLALLSLIDRMKGGTMEVDLTHRKFASLLRNTGFEVVAARPIGVWQFRYALAAAAGTRPRREAWLERAFSGRAWAHVAPDTIILARKVGTPA